MALSLTQQIDSQIDQSQRILVALPQNPNTDTICAALVLRAVLESKKKDVTLISDQFSAPEKLSFIKSVDQILPSFGKEKKYIIEIDTTTSPIADLSYQLKEDKLQIMLTPKGDGISPDAIRLVDTINQFDLIITMNTVELLMLGGLTESLREQLESVPVINIDHRPENELYGQINWVDIKATSVSEMMYSFLFREKKISKGLATILLAGMMDETHAFRTSQVNSSSLAIVGKLLDAGADHEMVVNHIYRTKSVAMLRLWGHVLDHLQADREHSLAWSVVPEAVFASTGTNRSHLDDLMNEILSHTPEAKTVLLFLQEKEAVQVIIRTRPPLHAKDLIKNWQPAGSERHATATLKQIPLHQAEQEVIKVVKERLGILLRTN